MASNPVQRKWTFKEYLAYEEEIGIKHEYLDGEIYAMAGSTENHSLITLNTTTEIGLQLREKSCRQHSSDMKIKISDIRYLYPDFSVVCGQAIFDDDKHMILTNPILVAEVLSDSTETFDRGKKFQHYRQLSSLKEYVLVSQDAARIEHFYLQENGKWEFSDAEGRDASVILQSIGCTLALSHVYENVTFEEASE